MAVGMLAGVIASVGMPMVMLYDLAPVCPFASVATAVKLKVPDAVGVPEISPAAERVKPVSYTHLDVYKRQVRSTLVVERKLYGALIWFLRDLFAIEYGVSFSSRLGCSAVYDAQAACPFFRGVCTPAVCPYHLDRALLLFCCLSLAVSRDWGAPNKVA